MQEYVPFTLDGTPPALVPKESRFTLLLMEEAHRRKHSGVQETAMQFRLSGYWTPQANKLARTVRNRCVTCKRLDKRPLEQTMGQVPREQLQNLVPWGHVELDLFVPFVCRSDVNKRSTMKVWGMVVVDKNSGAVHCDVVMNYSVQKTLKTLRRFAALRGWPSHISSDPGSQLESASGKMESWWNVMRNQLADLASSSNFKWSISPGNSPWRQGSSEVRVKCIKRLIHTFKQYCSKHQIFLMKDLLELLKLLKPMDHSLY